MMLLFSARVRLVGCLASTLAWTLLGGGLSALFGQAAAESLPPQQALGGPGFENWEGLQKAGNGIASLDVPDGRAVYTAPDGPRGAYKIGLAEFNDSLLDLRPWYGIRFAVQLTRDDVPFTANLTLTLGPQGERPTLPDGTSAQVSLQGKGWHTLTVPWDAFDYNRGQAALLGSIKKISLTGYYGDGPSAEKGGSVSVRDFRLVRGNVIHLDCGIRSQPAEAGGTVTYPVQVVNCSDAPQLVTLVLQRTGWEGMPAEVTPKTVALQPGESKSAEVKVTVPAEVPPGARETQTLVALPSGDSLSPERIDFVTLRRLPFPYLVHTAEEWNQIRSNVAQYDWAKADQEEIVQKADAWKVPAILTGAEAMSTAGTPALFATYEPERNLWNAAYAWKLTGNKEYAEKAAAFLREFSDPTNGYPKTLHATKGDIPQEGAFFENCARAYDAIQDAGVLSAADRARIEQAFRLYVGWNIDGLGTGGISNWSVFNLGPAAECALVLQDMASFDRLMNGPDGVIDQLRYGMMDDGWWYEMSLSYNLGVAECFTSLGLAARPFGIDFLHEKFPAPLTQKVGLRAFEFQNFEGMAFGKFGPLRDNAVTLKKMWDGIVAYPDYRGIMFGMGDGHEESLSGGRFEEAYYAFRDPAYAAIIKQSRKRDLLYAVPELPQDTPKLYGLSAHADNAGIAVLRSQTAGREPREQIQAAFKYGTHGGYHGHFDRLSLLSLMRYGRSFYNPETAWFGYGSFMYKWWVQTSLAHNMVVVDAKMQEAKECSLLLFHSGPMLQAVAAETDARWSNPPYFGGYKKELEKDLAARPPPVAVPPGHPEPGSVTDYTEPVRQRRLMLVTDDYVVLVDDLQAQREHTFDNLMHLRGAAFADPSRARLLAHDGPFDANPLGSGQFITDCDRFAVTAPAVVHSIDHIGERNGTLSEPGVLQIDEHILWPANPKVVVGAYPMPPKVPDAAEEPRKTVSVRSKGTGAHFITLLEPYEDKPMVESAVALGPDRLRIELADGVTQEIQIDGLEAGQGPVTATISESQDGKITRTETAASESGDSR